MDDIKARKKEQSNFDQGGRATIDDMRRLRYSSRAIQGRLSVIRQRCPYCCHHKALQNTTKTKCARCKRGIEE